MTLATASAGAGVSGFLAGLASMRRRVRRALGEVVQARWHADHDALTGLPNRTAARLAYHRSAEQAAEPDAAVGARAPHAVALLDLDDFKSINDTWGHQTGDAHLVAIAKRLADSCRSQGITVYRLGGDEFVVLLPSSDPQTLTTQIGSVVAALGEPLPVLADGHAVDVTHPSASVGIAAAEPGDSFSDVLRRADIALYNAKRHGLTPCVYSHGLGVRPATHRRDFRDVVGAEAPVG